MWEDPISELRRATQANILMQLYTPTAFALPARDCDCMLSCFLCLLSKAACSWHPRSCELQSWTTPWEFQAGSLPLHSLHPSVLLLPLYAIAA